MDSSHCTHTLFPQSVCSGGWGCTCQGVMGNFTPTLVSMQTRMTWGGVIFLSLPCLLFLLGTRPLTHGPTSSSGDGQAEFTFAEGTASSSSSPFGGSTSQEVALHKSLEVQ